MIREGEGLRRLHRRREGRLRRRGEDHPVPGRHPRGDRHVPRLGRHGPADVRRCGRSIAATGFPAELVPLAILRSLTGSGSLAFTTDLDQDPRPRLAHRRARPRRCTGRSETTFYVLAVYFGAVGVRRTRHAVPAALIGDISRRPSPPSPSVRGCSEPREARRITAPDRPVSGPVPSPARRSPIWSVRPTTASCRAASAGRTWPVSLCLDISQDAAIQPFAFRRWSAG